MSNRLPLRVDKNAAVPIAAQLAQQLSWLIVSRAFSQGDQLPPIRSLSEQLGINLHTVRAAYRQLDEDGLVSVGPGRRARVLKYDRSRVRASTAEIPSYSIGVIIPEFTTFYGPMLDAIESAATDLLAMVFICNAHENPETALSHIDRLVTKQVDGIISVTFGVEPGDPLPPKVIFVDTPGSQGHSSNFDLKGAQFMATAHLISHGHQRIGYLTPPLHLPNIAPKYDGHQAALDESGLPTLPEVVAEVRDFSIKSGEEGANRLLALAEPPTAIAAATDNLALGALRAIASRGLRIPEDIALIGNDDIETASLVSPSLTTISLPVAEAGRLAVEALDNLSSNDPPAQSSIRLKGKLITRASCGCDSAG